MSTAHKIRAEAIASLSEHVKQLRVRTSEEIHREPSRAARNGAEGSPVADLKREPRRLLDKIATVRHSPLAGVLDNETAKAAGEAEAALAALLNHSSMEVNALRAVDGYPRAMAAYDG
jgi:hypothetical protein